MNPHWSLSTLWAGPSYLCLPLTNKVFSRCSVNLLNEEPTSDTFNLFLFLHYNTLLIKPATALVYMFRIWFIKCPVLSLHSTFCIICNYIEVAYTFGTRCYTSLKQGSPIKLFSDDGKFHICAVRYGNPVATEHLKHATEGLNFSILFNCNSF